MFSIDTAAKAGKSANRHARAKYNWRIFTRGVKAGVKSIHQHAWMTVAATFTMAVTLIMAGLMMAALVNVNQLATDIQNNVEVRVMIDQKATASDKAQLKKEIQDLGTVKSVAYSSRQHELKSITHTFGSSFNMFKGDSNPLYDVYVVKVNDSSDLQSTSDKIAQMGAVQDTQFGGNSARKLIKLTNNLKKTISAIIIVFVLISLFLISNTIRIAMNARRQEIMIMQYVGATDWFIRLPLFVEGAITGLMAAIPSMIIIDGFYIWGYRSVQRLLADSSYQLANLLHSMIAIDLFVLLLAIMIGIFGSVISVQKFLRQN